MGTDNHTEGTFGDTKWIEILHTHFPDTIAAYMDEKIIKIYPEVTAVERQTAWDNGFSLGMTDIKGTIYHNPGIGRMMSRHSLLVVKQADEIFRWLHYVTDQFKTHYGAICHFFHVNEHSASFKLRFGSRTFEIEEITTRQVALTYPGIIDENILP